LKKGAFDFFKKYEKIINIICNFVKVNIKKVMMSVFVICSVATIILRIYKARRPRPRHRPLSTHLFFIFEYMSFFFFSACLLIASFGVIFSSNPIFSVINLIFVFCNTAGLFFILNTNYIAFIYIIIYMGAIIVLFLFTVMMLDISIISVNYLFSHYSWVSIFIITITSYSIFSVIDIYSSGINFNVSSRSFYSTDINLFGQLIYTYFSLPFIILSLLLFNAMFGAIVITLLKYSNLKHQVVFYQNIRELKHSVIFKKKNDK